MKVLTSEIVVGFIIASHWRL